MNAKIRQRLARCKRRIERRLDKRNTQGCDRPVLTASNIHYEMAERTRAIAAGGIGLIHPGQSDRSGRGDRPRVQLLKVHLPYHESDHVLNIAYNLLAGGTCLEHLELLRNDEVVSRRAGRAADSRSDHGRRLLPPLRRRRRRRLQEIVQRDAAEGLAAAAGRRSSTKRSSTPTARWSRPPASASREWTSATRASGATIRWWSRWPTRASRCTGQPQRQSAQPRAGGRLFRPGDRAVPPRRVPEDPLRGDTDFTQTEHLDRWDGQRRAVRLRHRRHAEPVRNGRGNAARTPGNAGAAGRSTQVQDASRGRRPENVKEQIVEAPRVREHPPGEGARGRVRLPAGEVPQDLSRGGGVEGPWKSDQGQKKLFDDCPLLLLHHQRSRSSRPKRSCFEANDRCNQENLHRATQERRAVVDRAGGQPGEQLGLHGDGLAGLEPEGLGGAAACPRSGPLAGRAPRGKADSCCGWTSPRSARR